MTDHPPRFDQVNVVVQDMEASLAFYRLLGFEFEESPPEWANHHRSAKSASGLDLDLDSAQFARIWNPGWPGRGGGGVVLGLRVATRQEVDDLHARVVAAGHASQQEPYDTFWGGRFAIVEDPDGNAIGVQCEPDPERRRPPPSPADW